MFIFRRLFFTAVLLVAVFLGASLVLENFAESQMSTGVGKTLGLQARPDVEIDAFPIILRVLQGNIPRVQVAARDLVVEHLEIAELNMDLEGVHADVDVLIRSDLFDLKVDKGEGSARITEDSVNAFLVYSKVDAHVTFRPDGTVFVRSDRTVGRRIRRFEATGAMSLDGRTLIFKPARVLVDGRPTSDPSLAARARRATAFSVQLPKLPGNILPSEVDVTKGEVTLVATLNGYVLKLSK